MNKEAEVNDGKSWIGRPTRWLFKMILGNAAIKPEGPSLDAEHSDNILDNAIKADVFNKVDVSRKADKPKIYERKITYTGYDFDEILVREVVDAFMRIFAEGDNNRVSYRQMILKFDEDNQQSERNYLHIEEWYADYRKKPQFAHIYLSIEYDCSLRISSYGMGYYDIAVSGDNNASIEEIFGIIDRKKNQYKLPEKKQEPIKPIIFIGHGRSILWRDLKDHLHDKHGIKVEAYEIGARAGHAIRDILQDMMKKSTFALLVMTGEDVTQDGQLRTRQNVIHEAGLFQGRLGFNRAIALVEDGVELFSNIEGIEQIRFSKGNIKETFGDVLAVLKREFHNF